MYPNSYDVFQAIKSNGDQITEVIPIPASANPIIVNVKYTTLPVSGTFSIAGLTQVYGIIPITNQYRVYYGTTQVEFGPTGSTTLVTAIYTTRGTRDKDIPLQGMIDSITAIEGVLGITPNGTFTTVADRLANIETHIMHQHRTEKLSFLCDGSTNIFNLAATPSDTTVTLLIWNGTVLTFTDDFTITGNQITMSNIPNSGDKLVVHYIA